jgi:hypothetical protein
MVYFIKNSKSKIINNPESKTCLPVRQVQNPKWVHLLYLICVLFFTSCENKNIIPEDTFVKVYADFLIVQDTSFIDSREKGTTPEQADSFKQMIFRKHNITHKQYEETLKYYNQNPELWEKFFEKAIAYVENQKKKSRPPSQVKKKES